MNKSDIIFVFYLIICSLFLSVNTLKLNKLRVSAKSKPVNFAFLLQKDNGGDGQFHDFCRQLFDYIDADHSHTITERKTADAVQRLRDQGQTDLPSRDEIHRYFEKNPVIDFDQFEHIMREENQRNSQRH